MNTSNNILLAFYGDDLTGSTDALEFICRAGAKAVLFMEPPTPEQVQAFEGLQAFGVAGLTRSLSPAKMEDQLLPAFKRLKATGSRHVHYKVCSTFDSSPQTGSIGRAMDCGAAIFHNKFIPVLGGMPALGRYCVFGNLFARMGIGSNGNIYRLDRHPSMSKHPVTPAHESDLRLHLGAQTKRKIGLIDVVAMEKELQHWMSGIHNNDEVVLLDALKEEDLTKIGAWLDDLANDNVPLFSIGSSGIEMALGNHWQMKNILQPKTSWQSLNTVSPLLVISGSCSPVTAAQIAYSKAAGFEEVILPAKQVCENGQVESSVVENLLQCLQEQKHVILHTGSKDGANLSSEQLGTALGRIAKKAIQKTGIRRVVIAGGDTSSYAARAMEIEALEMIAPFVSGAPMCKVHSENKFIQNLEVNLKGGQVGSEDYFVKAVGETC